jgi:hypothetical protein
MDEDGLIFCIMILSLALFFSVLANISLAEYRGIANTCVKIYTEDAKQ